MNMTNTNSPTVNNGALFGENQFSNIQQDQFLKLYRILNYRTSSGTLGAFLSKKRF